ncbi:cold-shock protein [Stutzerimonas nitrititolerans]|uniref:cold-shock protein n=1 Tax=Stutzerimonas nitrititolerans TaxID=2482751 RepID=UPI001BDBD36D|nr:cold-shock protein [Stutzerimonas nitrititolerans]MBT1118701.1 cold-shock protein [Stutzerimonas nitrititolerans]
MLKIVHVLTGILALVLSFVPSLSSGIPLLLHPEAICLLLLGLLNAQFIPSAQLHARGSKRPVILAVSILLVLAVVIQIGVLLIPVSAIAGQPATLASLLLAFIAVLLHLATAQTRDERHGRTAPAPRARNTSATAPAAGRETGTVKWFNTSKGFGFISRDSGDDVFVHFRAIRGEGHRVLVEGQRVEYTIMMRDKGLQAEDVVTTH